MEVRELLNRLRLSDMRDPDRAADGTDGDGRWQYQLEWDHEGLSILASAYSVTYYIGGSKVSYYQFQDACRAANSEFIPEHEQNRLAEIQNLIDHGTLLDWDFSSRPGKVLVWRDILGGDLIYTANDGWYYGYKTAQKPISNKEAISVLTKLKEIEGVLK